MRRACAAVAVGVWLAAVAEVHAHAFAPSLLAVHEGASGEAAVTWKTPRLRVMGSDVRPALPAGCRDLTAPVTEETESAVTLRWRVDCRPAGLIGRRIGIDGLATANTNGFIRVALADGRLIQQVVTIAAPSLLIPAPPRPIDVLSDYAWSGITQMLRRADRLLFVLGLLLLVPAPVAMVKTLAAFTLGHSVTLPAAILGLVSIPSRSIEIVLAVTILALATELAREPACGSALRTRPPEPCGGWSPAADVPKPTADGPSRTWMRRFPWAMVFAFGLLHGLGFAAVLREIGLPAADIPLALLAFNVGIEIGQWSFVCLMLVVTRPLRSWPRPLPQWARQVPVYVMGSLAAFWCFERAAGLLR